MEAVLPKKPAIVSEIPKDERQPHETHGPSGPPMLSSDLRVLSIIKEGTKEKDPFMAKTSHAGSDHCVDESKTNQRGNAQA